SSGRCGGSACRARGGSERRGCACALAWVCSWGRLLQDFETDAGDLGSGGALAAVSGAEHVDELVGGHVGGALAPALDWRDVAELLQHHGADPDAGEDATLLPLAQAHGLVDGEQLVSRLQVAPAAPARRCPCVRET